MSHFDSALEAELLTLDFRGMYTRWMDKTPLRSGMHASAVLDAQFCAREQVLHEIWPEQGEKPEVNHWDWKRSAIFENGWMFHRRIQNLHAKCGNVVWSPVSDEQAEDIRFHIPPAQHKYYVKRIDGQWYAAELDLTHYDAERNLYFSPDMITLFGGQKYVWELKGIKHEAFEELTDNLETACSVNETVHKAREQCNLYMQVLCLAKGIIFVENKSNQNFKLWVIEHSAERAWPYTPRMYEVKGRTLLVKQHGRSKLPPRCCKTIEDSRAKKCPMKRLCFQQGEDW